MSGIALEWVEDAYRLAGEIPKMTTAAAEARHRETMLLALADIRTAAAMIREYIVNAEHNVPREKGKRND